MEIYTIYVMFTCYDVCSRYEQEITHPLQNLLGGELFRAILIQVYALYMINNWKDNVSNNKVKIKFIFLVSGSEAKARY